MCEFCEGREIKTIENPGNPFVINAVYCRYPEENGQCLEIRDPGHDRYYDISIKYCPLCGKKLTGHG